MKIIISTLYELHNNCGTILQSIALKKYIESKGHTAVTVDYSNAVYKYGVTDFKSFVIRWGVNLMFAPQFIVRSHRYNKFIKKYNTVTSKKYLSYAKLQENPPEGDVYISGSDQIWNPRFPCGRDDTFYLKYTDSPNKMAYASSTGTSELTTTEYKTLIDKIKDFKFVSVREKDAEQKLKELGRQDVLHVCDPVGLLSKEQYQEMITYNLHLKKKYILVYAINKDLLLEEVVIQLAKLTGLKIIVIGGFAKKCESDIFMRTAGPNEFLCLMNHASYVVTSSFHGLMFSLIFKKQFIIIEPAINKLRLQSLTQITNTTNRIVNNLDSMEALIDNPINYNSVSVLFDKFIAKSKAYLDTAFVYFEESLGENND